MWRYEISKVSPPSWKSASVTRYELTTFVRKCDPKAVLDEKNAEGWVLKFLMEEGGYKAKDIESLKITPVEVICAASANY